MEEKAWRVILRFKSKSGYSWVSNTFGKNNSLSEYFIWIDSRELKNLNLSNTSRNAEILAVNYGIKRFEDTKDSHGFRDITRIIEKNSAFFNGAWHLDSLLPENLS